MYVRVVFPELVNKNIPKQINTIVNRDSNPEEPRVLALEDLVLLLRKFSPLTNLGKIA